MGLLRFSISSWFSFGKLYFAKNLSIFPSCPFYWYIAAGSNLLQERPQWVSVKNPPAMQEPQETWVQSLGLEDPLEKGMATHFSILVWRTSGIEEPGVI